MRRFSILFALLTVAGAGIPSAPCEDLRPLLKTLQAVGPKGAGNAEAAKAWEQLVRTDAAQLPAVLAALDGANPLAANWIRTAADTIAERTLRSGGKLPADKLERFVLDTGHNPRARRLAYEWLCRVDSKTPDRLIPGMLNDPSVELRRDAVARVIDEGKTLQGKDETAKAAAVYRRALSSARDLDQIRLLTDRLRKMKQTVDLPRHLGFLVRWKVIGPFDNTGEKGFDVAYPPEKEIDFKKTCKGKHGEVKWIGHVTGDDYGRVDFHKVLKEEKAVVAYAAAEFISEKQQEVEFRTTSFNAVKLWLNGNLIDRHNAYHGGSQLDQYVCRATLRQGKNAILIKVCQNEQTQSWARPWGFHLRVCDESSTAVLSTDRDAP